MKRKKSVCLKCSTRDATRRGLCDSCYQMAWKNGELELYERKLTEPGGAGQVVVREKLEKIERMKRAAKAEGIGLAEWIRRATDERLAKSK